MEVDAKLAEKGNCSGKSQEENGEDEDILCEPCTNDESDSDSRAEVIGGLSCSPVDDDDADGADQDVEEEGQVQPA